MGRLTLLAIAAVMAACSPMGPLVVGDGDKVAVVVKQQGTIDEAIAGAQPLARAYCEQSGFGSGAEFDREVTQPGDWTLYFNCFYLAR